MARILVVEDDVLVLCTLVRQLTDLGHVCVSTTSPRMALAVIAALKGARIIRAHDVAATVDALKVAIAVEGGG